jgi:hypothetical protein
MMKADEPNEDERAARAAASLKETEDLLAGFDRPGRTPRTPPVKRDFVDYHLEKGRSNPAAKPVKGDRDRRDLPTAIIPDKRRSYPAWLPWAALLFVMSFGGALLAASLVGSPSGTTAPSSTAPAVPTSLGPRVESTSGPERDIPPPPPPGSPVTAETDPDPIVDNVAAPPASTGAAPSSGSSGVRPRASAAAATSGTPAAPAPSTSVTPSGDFIRNL